MKMPKHTTHARPEGATLAEIAATLGVTKETVRKIELAALRKCRKWCDKRGLRLEDLMRNGPDIQRDYEP